jgi:hypothetical protein
LVQSKDGIHFKWDSKPSEEIKEWGTGNIMGRAHDEDMVAVFYHSAPSRAPAVGITANPEKPGGQFTVSGAEAVEDAGDIPVRV